MKLFIINKFKLLYPIFKGKEFNYLDIGCGNHSVQKTKSLFPRFKYYGVDLDKSYNNDERDFLLMEKFFEMDITMLKFDRIPDNYFDVIMMSHIIEHLPNGDDVILNLVPKLKKGGYFYIEFPSLKSTNLPHMKGTLNFFDDPTHIRIYLLKDLFNLFLKENFIILNGGVRRNLMYILATPLRIVYELIKFGYVNGPVFYDICGSAEYLFVQKSKNN